MQFVSAFCVFMHLYVIWHCFQSNKGLFSYKYLINDFAPLLFVGASYKFLINVKKAMMEIA